MKEKLRTILHTAWHEPRHFFLWLALLSICGFAITAVGINLPGPNLLVGAVAIASMLCFLGSILAFILAWIPPVRRFLSWLLRWRFLALSCLVTLIALFYAIENWRGHRAWQDFKHDREAKGEQFDMANLIPPPVPGDENFFESPLWSDLHFAETNGTVVWNDKKWEERVIFSRFPPKSHDVPSESNWMKSQHVDLAAWQAFYRGSNNLVSTENPADYFPVGKEPQSPAADVLLALSRFKDNRQILLATSTRTHARFWNNYGAGVAMQLVHLPRIKSCSQYLSLHATAALKAKDTQTALEDTKIQFRLIDSIRNEPILISYLVRSGVLQIALQPVWEGLADRQWTEADLNAIQSELGKLDFLADYHFAIRSERACNLWVIDYIHKSGIYGFNGLFPSDSKRSQNGDEGGDNVGEAMFRLIPAGWFDQNKLSLCRGYETYVLPAVDRERHLVPPGFLAQSQAAISRQTPRPFDVISRLFLPAVIGSVARCARTQTSVDLARVACALERYRLANGQFPETLDALAPKFIEALPHDIINGQPLKYHRTQDGQFVLYSVGWNQTDDGGKVELYKEGQPDMKLGDWVWRY
ncbi:MAG TPA: hypothetical protein VFD66_03215 [Verrucomicrobiae bacterium]|nr:hypothetical protein [Verrucomicrobiae bacterium]